MKKFELPEIEVVLFRGEDILTTSGTTEPEETDDPNATDWG